MTDKMEMVEDFYVLLRCLSRYLEGLGSGGPGIDGILLRWAGALPVRAPERAGRAWPSGCRARWRTPLAGLSEPAPPGGPRHPDNCVLCWWRWRLTSSKTASGQQTD